MEISVSLDPSVDTDLEKYLAIVNGISGVSIHCDIMRKPFVERNAVTPAQLSYIIANAKHPVDVHIMANESESRKIALQAKDARCVLTHPNTAIDLDAPVTSSIKKQTCVVVMSVKAGRSGQKFNPTALEKVRDIKRLNPKCRVILDGGINPDNIVSVANAGVDVAVVGSYIYNAKDRKAAVELLRQTVTT